MRFKKTKRRKERQARGSYQRDKKHKDKKVANGQGSHKCDGRKKNKKQWMDRVIVGERVK